MSDPSHRIPGPLEPFAGERPPAPAWFEAAIHHPPERFFAEAGGVPIEIAAWGERGKPGLLLIPGASAHADWWSWIAPQFADRHRIAAISLSGMGDSGWREVYRFSDYAQEMEAAARAAGLYDSGAPPVYIGHSFGGAAVYYAARANPERMTAAILIDTGFGAGRPASVAREARPPRVNRVYPTLQEALARFRFMPPQDCANLYIADHIARTSLKPALAPDGEMGLTWKFDPNHFGKLDRGDIARVSGSKAGPVAHVFGDRSKVMAYSAARQSILPPGTPRIAIPDSDHHVMVDQPLALVAALRTLLSVWP